MLRIVIPSCEFVDIVKSIPIVYVNIDMSRDLFLHLIGTAVLRCAL